MPIFEVQVKGAEKPRLVKAATAAAARSHLVDAKAIGAERMAELLEAGAVLEKADPEPAANADDDGKGDDKGGEK